MTPNKLARFHLFKTREDMLSSFRRKPIIIARN